MQYRIIKLNTTRQSKKYGVQRKLPWWPFWVSIPRMVQGGRFYNLDKAKERLHEYIQDGGPVVYRRKG